MKRKIVRLAGSELPQSGGGGDKSCLTTYIFNPVDTCTGTPSPEKFPLKPPQHQEPPKPIGVGNEVAHMHSNFLYGKILQDGRPNFLTEYELSYKNCNFDLSEHGKCCVGGRFGRDLSFGHLYTISRSDKEERTYDEPYTGDLPRRSWLCCPGSQHHIDGEQPALLDANLSVSTPSEAITKAPGTNSCSGNCVGILYFEQNNFGGVFLRLWYRISIW